MGEGEPAGLRKVAAAIDVVHEQVPGSKTITCLEITAGQGSSLGYRLEHLAEIIERVREPKRLGVCLDTAHLFAAGYDFRGRKYCAVPQRAGAAHRPQTREVSHLNDSKKELGSAWIDMHTSDMG